MSELRRWTAAARPAGQHPGRRQVVAAQQLSASAIYRARAVQAALPRARARICEQQCHEQADGREACDALYCKATVQMRPRPRSIAALARDYYINQGNPGGPR